MSDTEETFEAPKTAFPTFGNLENCKRAFFTKDYETFEKELGDKHYLFFRVSYKHSSEEMDGKPEFIARNFLGGFVKELDDFRKYFFCVFRCVKPDRDESKYQYDSLWIVNTSELDKVYGDRKNDFCWTHVSRDEFKTFVSEFKPTDKENVIAEKYVH